jgi:FAD/FMN-containing dehydrogenase
MENVVLDSNNLVVDDDDIQGFKTRLRGPVIQPGDPEYDKVRTIWNARIDKRPACIVRCTGVADIIEAVNFARTHHLLLAVRGGGHNIAGAALCDGGLVVDLSLMKGIRLDLEQRTIRAQSGCTLGDLDRETQAFGYAVPVGIVSGTGIAGLTLGGGFGWLSRKYGYACDNLRSVDIVTADGRFLTTSVTQNADLFWGVRGGGGNFGIVTSFEYDLQPLGPEVMAGMVLYPMTMAAEVLKFFEEFTTNAPDELTSLLFLRIAPSVPALPEHVRGVPVAGIAVCYAGPVDKAIHALEPLKAFAVPLHDSVRPTPFVTHQTMLDAAQPPGRYYYWKSEYLLDLSADARNELIAQAIQFPSSQSAVFVMHLGGAVSQVGEHETAVSHRNAKYLVNIAASWLDPELTDLCTQWAREYWAAIRPFSSGGVYVNFLTEEEGQSRVMAAYGARKYERLVALKNKYDPTNLFRVNQNIMPTV